MRVNGTVIEPGSITIPAKKSIWRC
jgi:hypothetical protein